MDETTAPEGASNSGSEPIRAKTWLSFLVTSTGRPHEILSCVESIERAVKRAGRSDVEVIVLVQDGGDPSAIQRSMEHLAVALTVVATGTRRLSRARNLGIGISRGSQLFFLDDDAVLDERAITVLASCVNRVSFRALCGRMLELHTRMPYGKHFRADRERFLTYGSFQFFMGSAHVVRRGVFERFGLYDERFGAGGQYPACEETDLFFRLVRGGEPVFYCPDMVVYHPSASGFSIAKTYQYGYANGALHAKHFSAVAPFRHFHSFTRVLLVNLVRAIVSTATRQHLDLHCWNKLKGNLAGFLEYWRTSTSPCSDPSGSGSQVRRCGGSTSSVDEDLRGRSV